MKNIEIRFTKFINKILMIILPLIIIASVGMLFATLTSFNIGTIVFAITILTSSFIIYKIINSEYSSKAKVCLLIIIAVIIRILWLLNSDTVPNSDFKVMYDCASELIKGNTGSFKSTGYIARFPHLTMTVLYMSVMQYLFPINNLVIMKIINLSFGIVDLFLIYLIISLMFNDEKKSLIALGIGCIFPPLVTYTSVFCGENLAMPFYLISIYLFLKSINDNKNKYLYMSICGITLGIGNLFRMVADIVMIAYIIYIAIYCEEKVRGKLKRGLCIAISYFLVIFLVSGCIQKLNITEYPLWRGSEPKITNVLRGTNINSLGMWNKEDAEMVENNLQDYDLLNEKSKEIIYERLTTTHPIKLTIFYVAKLCAQWCIGDFAGSLWSEKDISEDKIIFKIGIFGSAALQLVYILILIIVFLGIKNKKCTNHIKEINLFYLIFLGYIAAYLITEFQNRYGYIVSWVLIILSIEGLSYIDLNKIKSRVINILWIKVK